VLILGLFNLCHYLHVNIRLFKVLSCHLLNVVKLGVFACSRALNLAIHVIEILLCLFSRLGYVLSAALEFVLFIADLHDLAGSRLEVLLQLLELSTLLKEGFGGSTALVLKDLLAFQVSTLGSLHEFVSIVLVSDLQVVECVGKSFDLLLTLADFPVKLVTVALELLFFLSSFDYKVSLCVFTISLHIST